MTFGAPSLENAKLVVQVHHTNNSLRAVDPYNIQRVSLQSLSCIAIMSSKGISKTVAYTVVWIPEENNGLSNYTMGMPRYGTVHVAVPLTTITGPRIAR